MSKTDYAEAIEVAKRVCAADDFRVNKLVAEALLALVDEIRWVAGVAPTPPYNGYYEDRLRRWVAEFGVVAPPPPEVPPLVVTFGAGGTVTFSRSSGSAGDRALVQLHERIYALEAERESGDEALYVDGRPAWLDRALDEVGEIVALLEHQKEGSALDHARAYLADLQALEAEREVDGG